MNDAMAEQQQRKEPKFQIFRAKDAPRLMETGMMQLKPTSDSQKVGMKKMVDAGMLEGEVARVLINVPGFSLIHAWFKAGYPLPLHSHDSDCLYYVVAGTTQFGTETLGAGDGVLLKANVPYTHTAGPEGVEILEFRTVGAFDFVNLAKNAAFFERGAQTIAGNLEGWREAVPPSQA